MTNDEALKKIKAAAESGKITLAEQDLVNDLSNEIDTVLEALGHPEALVTDESSIRDFYMSEQDFIELKPGIDQELGVKVEFRDKLWQVALKLKNPS